MKHVVVACVYVLCLGASAATACAQAESSAAVADETDANTTDEIARNLFHAGKVAFDGGSYADALQLFEQAYARSPRPGLLYNIGQAADRLRLDGRALEVFRQYLQEQPDAPNRTEVENRVRALDQLRASDQNAQSVPSEVAAEVAPVLTPAATAAASRPQARTDPVEMLPVETADVTTSQPSRQQEARHGARPITARWWFWTILGAVVVGGVVTGVALSSGDAAQPTYVQPDVGRTNVTLDRR